MNDQGTPSSSLSGDHSGEESSARNAFAEIPGTPNSTPENGLEQRLHRHRSGRRHDRELSRSSGAKPRTHSKGRNKRSPREMLDRWIMGGCCFLGAVAFLSIGFYFGHKFGTPADVSNRSTQQEIPLPTAEAESLLDTAFTAYQDGKYRVAMLDFQKAQDAQPGLFGIDYLIAESANKAGEQALAQDAAQHAVSKNELPGEARVLLAIINLAKSKSGVQEPQQLADPSTTAQNEIKQYMAAHPDDARAFAKLGDLLRLTGEYRSAVGILHKGVLRSDPEAARELLSAKEQLARIQNEPAKSAPSLSELTAMNGEQALAAALTSLQLKQSEEAAVFLERARDLYPPSIFRELMKDGAFADFYSDPKVKSFFKENNS